MLHEARILAAATGRENPGHVYDRFMTWLTSLPTAVLIIGGLAATLLLAAGARLAVRAVIPATQRDNAYTIAAPLMTALGGLFALTMALSLVGEAGLLASAQGIVSNESADASRLAWAATSAGVSPTPIQSALVTYLRDTRAYEWHGKNAAEGDGTATAHALANLEKVVRAEAARPAWPHPRAASCWPPSMPSPMIVVPASPRPHVSFLSFMWSSWSSPGRR